MALTNDLVSEFVKITNDSKKTTTKKEDIVYGTVKKVDGETFYIHIDGSPSDERTPASSTVEVSEKNRVIVMIKNHSAVITGNLGNRSTGREYVDASTGEIKKVADEAKTTATQAQTSANNNANKIQECEQLIAKKVSTEEFNTELAYIKDMTGNSVIVNKVKANETKTKELEAEDATIKGRLDVNEGAISDLQSDHAEFKEATVEDLAVKQAAIDILRTAQASFETATVTDLAAKQAAIDALEAKQSNFESASINYANIDFSNITEAAIKNFFAESGIIKDVTISEGVVVKQLVGVTISGDLIEGNTVKAEKLVVKGSDGLYYKLNVEAGATTSSEVTAEDLQNGLHGTAIIAKTITAEKISVDDLVAFGATIAGFHITEDNKFYSGTKSSATNTTRGIYQDSEGQMAVGDSNNFFRYYKASDGSYKLEISASSILLGTKSVETAINDVQKSVDNMKIGAENLYVKSANFDSDKWINTAAWTKDGIDSNGNARIKQGTWAGLYQFIKVKAGDVYTLSANVSGDGVADFRFYASLYSEPSANSTGLSGVSPAYSDRGLAPLEERRFRQTYTITEDGYLRVRIENGLSNSYIWVSSIKLERGNKSTDWSPAPEDMATSEEVDRAQNTADEANTKAENAETLIAQLKDSISMLVTDGNGTSLMTQTEDGWTFSTANIQKSVNAISENLNSLTEDLGGVNNTVDVLQQAVNDLGEIAEYVKITTYEDEPCIELGEGDSDFKLRITNTRMIFAEGSTVLAYFNNQSLHIKKAVVEDELQQGGFVWKVRSNGNLGLIWKGGNS